MQFSLYTLFILERPILDLYSFTDKSLGLESDKGGLNAFGFIVQGARTEDEVRSTPYQRKRSCSGSEPMSGCSAAEWRAWVGR